MRDEDEDGEGRRVKGLYELIRAEGVMIEGVDRRELPFPKRLLREETLLLQRGIIIRSYDQTRTIDWSHSPGIFIISSSLPTCTTS